MTTFAWVAVAVFVAAYILIATEWVHRVAAALGGAVIMLLIGPPTLSTRSSPRSQASTGTSSSCSSA